MEVICWLEQINFAELLRKRGILSLILQEKLELRQKHFMKRWKLGYSIMIDELHIDNPIEIFFAEG